MKKLTLKALNLGARELLNREQLKNVLGGDGSSGSTDCAGDKVTACDGKSTGTACCFVYQQNVYYGTCQANAPVYKMMCEEA
ncbi:hypothetical protein [Chitinophaga caseinilytica]|uniref:hypothetical protein n=1 Tax=Chitinophaga caseinilytica TaxID=2267521 RepID=UPI003C2B3BDD